MRIRKLVGLSVVMVLIIAGCRIKKEIVKEERRMTEDKALINNVIKNLSKEKWLEIRFAGKAKTGNESINLSGTVKIAENEWIWASLRSQIGIEVARIFGTPDSVWLNSKLLRIKEKGNWDLVREYTGYQMNFSDIQGIMKQGFLDETSVVDEQWADTHEVVYDVDDVWIQSLEGSGDSSIKTKGTEARNVKYRIGRQDYKILETMIQDERENPLIRILYTYAERSVGRIRIEGCGNLNDYSLEMHVTGYEGKQGLEYNFEKW